MHADKSSWWTFWLVTPEANRALRQLMTGHDMNNLRGMEPKPTSRRVRCPATVHAYQLERPGTALRRGLQEHGLTSMGLNCAVATSSIGDKTAGPHSSAAHATV